MCRIFCENVGEIKNDFCVSCKLPLLFSFRVLHFKEQLFNVNPTLTPKGKPMDFRDQIKQLADRIEKLKINVATEESTKNAFIMPMIQYLGYDVFNPTEVVPEFVADIGIKKGEKIDYAILREGKTLILIECKHWEKKLNLHEGQLLRYFQAANAKFGILTNGIKYRFYTDLEKPNIMDEKPFFEFDVTDMKDNQIDELKKFHKSYFDIESIVATASELKYTSEIRALLLKEIADPSEWFVRGIAKIVYDGVVTAKVYEQFATLTKKSFTQVINDMISDRLKNALKEEQKVEAIMESTTVEDEKPLIVTTEEELEGFHVVKSILRQHVDIKRVVCRDTQTYFGILLDDNNRKPICRLYFNGTKKYIAYFTDSNKETREELTSMDDIYKYADTLAERVRYCDSPKGQQENDSPEPQPENETLPNG